MTATPAEVLRENDLTGTGIAAFTNDAGRAVQEVALSAEVQGELLTAAATPGAAVIQATAKAGPGKVFRAEVVLIAAGAAGDRWLMVVDKLAAAINGDLPIIRSPKLSGDFASIDLGVWGVDCALGIQLVLSTSPIDVQLSPAESFFQWSVL